VSARVQTSAEEEEFHWEGVLPAANLRHALRAFFPQGFDLASEGQVAQLCAALQVSPAILGYRMAQLQIG